MTSNLSTGSEQTVRAPHLGVGFIALGDVGALNAGFVLAFIFRFGFDVARVNFEAYLRAAPIFSVFFLVILAAFDLYRRRRLTVRTAISSIGRPVLLTAMFGSSLVLFTGWWSFPRSVILLGFAMGGPLVFVWRVLVAKLESRFRGVERVLMVVNRDAVGDGDQDEILRRLAKISLDHVDLVGLVGHNDLDSINQLGPDIDVVMVSASVPQADRAMLIDSLVAVGQRVFLIPAAFELALHTGTPSYFYSIEGIELSDGRVPLLTAGVKRLVDIFSALLVLVLAAPLMVLTAAAIRLESPGKAFYRQERLGRQQQPFTIIKFRSMRNGAEASTGPVFASRNDARVTRVGRLIRKTRIDELPQMWNVLKGEMSLVGPRPERKVFVDEFIELVPAYRRRFGVRPGVTGLAQVRAGYSASAEEKLRFDLLYINQVSLLNDLRIAVQTVSTMLDFAAADGTVDLRDFPAEVEAMLSGPGVGGQTHSAHTETTQADLSLKGDSRVDADCVLDASVRSGRSVS